MDKILAPRREHAKVSTEEKLGNAIGKIIKIVLILIVIGGIGFMGYGAWMMLHPGKPFDDYPTRLDAVKGISAASPKAPTSSYGKPSNSSTCVRTTDNTHQDSMYKMVYTKMHDDFARLYGPDWLSKAKIEKEDAADNDEIVPFSVTLGDDVYHVLSQLQSPAEPSPASKTPCSTDARNTSKTANATSASTKSRNTPSAPKPKTNPTAPPTSTSNPSTTTTTPPPTTTPNPPNPTPTPRPPHENPSGATGMGQPRSHTCASCAREPPLHPLATIHSPHARQPYANEVSSFVFSPLLPVKSNPNRKSKIKNRK